MIYPALSEAASGIIDSEGEYKHILLLSDGQGETSDFKKITDSLNANDVTLSTVAMGTDADGVLLERLARQGAGRFYSSDSQKDIPRIFAKEVFLSGESYLQNGDFSLIVNGSDQLTAGLFEEGWPHIKGYVAASVKTGASSIIRSDKDNPILTYWQYGLGKSVAWNSDADGIWTGSFAGSDDYALLWRRISDLSFGQSDSGRDELDTGEKDADGEVIIRYKTQQFDNDTSVSGMYQKPDGSSVRIDLQRKKPGVFEGKLDESEPGIYFISLKKEESKEQTGGVTGAAVIQFSDEYRFDITDLAVKSFVRLYGKELTVSDTVWGRISNSLKVSESLVTLLLLMAVLLFVFDIASRRLELFRMLSLYLEGRRDEKAIAFKQDLQKASENFYAGSSEENGEHSGKESSKSDTVTSETVTSEETAEKAAEKTEMKTEIRIEKNTEKNTVKETGEEKGGLDTSLLLKKKRDRGGS